MSDSSKKQEPRIVEREELQTESKWMKLEKIHWEDQEGKAVCPLFIVLIHPQQKTGMGVIICVSAG